MNTGQKKGWEIKGEVTLFAIGCAKQICISNGGNHAMHGISTALGVWGEHARYIIMKLHKPFTPKEWLVQRFPN